MNKRAAILLIALLALVAAVSLSYYSLNQPNQTSNTPSPTPTPTPTPTWPSEEPASTPKPSVPEFTVKAVAHPYDVPTTYSTDLYTGETITHEGYHVENKSIEVWIKNMPFTPYNDTDGHEVNLYYSVRVKGHFGEDWGTPSTYSESDSAERIPQLNSEYTVLSLANYYNPKAKADYQVEAIVGHFYTAYYPPGHAIQFPYTAFQVDGTSGWSNTQTLTFS
jgi:hypothetical protein